MSLLEEKTTSWLDYYNWRNRLIVSSVHEDPEIMGVIPGRHAARYPGDQLWLRRRIPTSSPSVAAVVDFLLGPQHVLSSDAEVLHARVTDLFICCSGDEASVKAALTEQLAAVAGVFVAAPDRLHVAFSATGWQKAKPLRHRVAWCWYSSGTG